MRLSSAAQHTAKKGGAIYRCRLSLIENTQANPHQLPLVVALLSFLHSKQSHAPTQAHVRKRAQTRAWASPRKTLTSEGTLRSHLMEERLFIKACIQ